MKILILANDYKTIANFRMELLERLLSENNEVLLSLPEDDRNEQFRDMGCTVIENHLTRHGTNPFAELRLIGDYKRLISETSPDVVLTYTIKPNIYGSIACRRLNVPVMNNITGIGSTMQKKGIMQSVMFSLMRYAMKHSAVVFFQNTLNMELFNRCGIGNGKSVLLPGSGVNLDKHSFVPYPDETEKIKFIVVSRLREDKGYDELFSAVKRISADCDNVEFHVVGWYEEEKYKSIVQDMVNNCPVVYHGEKTQSEVHDLISQCHAIIHPSHHEGMANVLMEAAAAGRACIASDIPGCREIVSNGETGYTFPVRDTYGIENAVRKFLNLSYDERKSMGVNAREKIQREFDRQIVIDSYIKSIDKFAK